MERGPEIWLFYRVLEISIGKILIVEKSLSGALNIIKLGYCRMSADRGVQCHQITDEYMDISLRCYIHDL